MRRQHNSDDFYVDTGLLRDHVSKLREEKKTASRLYQNVAAMRNKDDPSNAYLYNSLLRDIEKLIAFYGRMADFLDDAGDDAVHMSHKVENLVEYDTHRARNTIVRSFML